MDRTNKNAQSSTWRVLDEDLLLGSQSTSSWGKDVEGIDVSDEDLQHDDSLGRGVEDEAEANLWGDDDDDDDDD